MKETSFNVRCTKELKEQLKAISIERQCSITDVVIDFVTKSITQYEYDKSLQKRVFFNINELHDM